MFLDVSQVPLVFVRTDVASDVNLETQLECVLAQQKPFVLISEHSEAEHADETHEEKKQRALFFKSIKESMRTYCKAMIVIETAGPVTAEARAKAAGVGKGLGAPLLLAESLPEALEIARGYVGPSLKTAE